MKRTNSFVKISSKINKIEKESSKGYKKRALSSILFNKKVINYLQESSQNKNILNIINNRENKNKILDIKNNTKSFIKFKSKLYKN